MHWSWMEGWLALLILLSSRTWQPVKKKAIVEEKGGGWDPSPVYWSQFLVSLSANLVPGISHGSSFCGAVPFGQPTKIQEDWVWEKKYLVLSKAIQKELKITLVVYICVNYLHQTWVELIYKLTICLNDQLDTFVKLYRNWRRQDPPRGWWPLSWHWREPGNLERVVLPLAPHRWVIHTHVHTLLAPHKWVIHTHVH